MAKKDAGKTQKAETAEPSQAYDQPVESSAAELNSIDSDRAAQEAEVLQQEVEALRQQLAGQQAKAEEYLDGWQRARAEFANYKKRVEREQEESRARVVADMLQDFVTILDDLERALRDRPTDGDAAAWASGIDMIQRKLMAVLDAEGVRPMIPVAGEMFDPNVHEAISHEPSPDHTEGQIIGIIHQGYRIGERVIRPALVRVAK